MGRQPGYDRHPTHPIPESIESVGAAFHLLSDLHAQRGDLPLATAYQRANRALWGAAQTLREQQQETQRSALPATNRKSA